MASDDQLLRDCLASDEFPWAVLVRGDDERVVTVADFTRYVASRGISATERDLDAFVERLGGGRHNLIDPWSAPGRLLRRAFGKPIETTDLYAIPHAAVADAADHG